MNQNKKNPSILLLLWHPEDAIAGGFVRVKELLPYFTNSTVVIIDNSPTLLPKDKYKHIIIKEYKIPSFIKKSYKIHYSLGRMLEWSHACYSLVLIGRSELKKNQYHVIYGPTGDNLHIFLAGILLKWMFPDKKLLLDILNLEMPEGSVKNYFRNFRKNKVSFFDSFLRTYYLAFLLFIERLLIKNCDFVVTVSPYMKNIIAKYFPIRKIDFTPSGVSIPSNISNKNKNKNTINGIYIGRHTKDKGIFDLVKVWERVSKKIPDSKLITAGAFQKEIKILLDNEIKSKKLESNIRIEGMVSEEEKWNLLSQSKYFLHLAYFEPLVPVITILEALASGLPVVMYDTKAVDDYPFLRKSKAIHIVRNKDINEATRAILYLEKLQKKEYEEISHEARNIAKKFNWKDISKKEIKVINMLLSL